MTNRKKPLEGKRVRVLLVDDDEIMRGIHRLVLNAIGVVEIFEAANGQEALDFLDEEIVSLVLTDIRMPVMNGVELLKRMREDDENREIPVIICSCVADKHYILEAIKAGAKDYILKPCKHEDLQEKIIKVLKKEQFLDKSRNKNGATVDDETAQDESSEEEPDAMPKEKAVDSKKEDAPPRMTTMADWKPWSDEDDEEEEDWLKEIGISQPEEEGKPADDQTDR